MKTLDENVVERLGDRLASRVDNANQLFLEKIGESLKTIRDLTPSQAQQLVQMLKYGGGYEELIKEMSRITGLNVKDIDKIFANYAKRDLYFAKEFYQYRNMPYIPYEENMPLRRQTEALSNITKTTMANFARSNALGYTIKGLDGKVRFRGLRETYETVLDEALLNLSQGKDSFDSAMKSILNELGNSGLKTLDYSNGRHIRLDSMVRMHLRGGLSDLHNENQRLFGQEFNADGVEISVHEYPAEDHEDAQGKQFYYDDFEQLQDTGIAKDVNGEEINMHLHLKDGSSAISHRPIGELNCYHTVFSIIVGVSTPEYDKKRLNEIKKRNKDGFEYEGKHYTMYQGTQMQRKLELEIRKAKDVQILAKSSDNKALIDSSQYRITQLTRKYERLCNISGLPSKLKRRARVSGYKRTSTKYML